MNEKWTHRICRDCKEKKSVSDFHSGGRGTKGRRATCKDCFNRERRKERSALLVDALMHYSDGSMQCACCGESRVEFLTLDHIEGRSALGNKKKWSSISILYGLTGKSSWPKDLRVLCYNCNLSRGRYGYCPHERETEQNLTVIQGGIAK